MTIITSDRFLITIPGKYKVIKHDFYKKNKEFFDNYPSMDYEDIPGLSEMIKKNPPNLESLRGCYGYEVKMGKHSFLFHTEITDNKPEYLKDFILSQTRQRDIELKEFQINNYKGKMYGDYSDEFTWIDWWIKEGDCMICFNIQGLGEPSEVNKSDILEIFKRLRYQDEEVE